MTQRAACISIVLALVSSPIVAQDRAPCPVARSGAVVIYGEVTNNVTVTAAELASAPRTTIKGTAHDGTTAEYTGVPLHHLLARAGLPAGAQMRGAELQRYVVLEGRRRIPRSIRAGRAGSGVPQPGRHPG